MVDNQNGSESLQKILVLGWDYNGLPILGDIGDLILALDPIPWAYMLTFDPNHGRYEHA